jgi:SAM-dependent methyltransferase
MVYNSLLRIPKDAPLSTWFGTMPKGQEGGQPYTLDIDAMTASGPVSVSLAAPGGVLQSDLIVSSTQPTQNLAISLDELKAVIKSVANKKVGLEIGGPSRPCERTDLYRIAAKTDLVNFSEKTLWGTFQDGSIFNYTEGAPNETVRVGQGTVRITDGQTLVKIADSSYDFVLGSHYLEHLIDPLSALLSMHRVTKPGGTIMLVLPRKEACFDHLRGQSRMEEILFRYIHKAQSDDLRYVNLNSWIFGNDLSWDGAAGSFHQLLARSIRFENNRSIHTMVYDLKLLEQLGKILSLKVVFKGLEGNLHQWIIFKKL